MGRHFYSVLFLVLSWNVSSQAYFYYRPENGFFFGGGAQKSFLTLESSDAKSQFEGWGYALEGGFRWLWTRAFGLDLSASYEEIDVINNKKSNIFIEKSENTQLGLRVGFFVNQVGFGYGESRFKATIKQVSTQTGSQTSQLSDTIPFYYINYSLPIEKKFRVAFEIQKIEGKLENYKVDEYKLLMKFFILTHF